MTRNSRYPGLRLSAKIRTLIRAALLCVLIAASVCACADPGAFSALPVMKLWQFDVGCADAYLLTAGDTVLLIDCGTDTDATEHVPYRMLRYIRETGIDHVDAYFVTHYHNDHAINIDLLLALYGTKDTVLYGPSESLPERFLPLRKATYKQLRDGDRLKIGDFDIVCVGPSEVLDNGESNRDSLNFVIRYGDHKFFFTGDYADYTLAERHPDEISGVDVLKFPHHGLNPIYIYPKTLCLARPRIILVPSHDTRNVRKWLSDNRLSADVYGTSGGNTLITSDGNELKVTSPA